MINKYLKELKEFWYFMFPKSKRSSYKDLSKTSIARFKKIHEKYDKAPVLYAIFGELNELYFKEKIMKLDFISMLVIPAKKGSPEAKQFFETLIKHLEQDIKNLKEALKKEDALQSKTNK